MPENFPANLLSEKAQLQPQPFQSRVPVVGPVIAWFRTAWNNVAARWYVQAVVEQQNQFNLLVVEQLRTMEARLIEQDRLQTELIHQLAELTAMWKEEGG
ncbi:MAG: hypothetical protein Fur0021_19260 [Candidatus Promineifilaceae bacterium]